MGGGGGGVVVVGRGHGDLGLIVGEEGRGKGKSEQRLKSGGRF